MKLSKCTRIVDEDACALKQTKKHDMAMEFEMKRKTRVNITYLHLNLFFEITES